MTCHPRPARHHVRQVNAYRQSLASHRAEAARLLVPIQFAQLTVDVTLGVAAIAVAACVDRAAPHRLHLLDIVGIVEFRSRSAQADLGFQFRQLAIRLDHSNVNTVPLPTTHLDPAMPPARKAGARRVPRAASARQSHAEAETRRGRQPATAH